MVFSRLFSANAKDGIVKSYIVITFLWENRKQEALGNPMGKVRLGDGERVLKREMM